jgi:hypothetical protein
MTAEQLEQIVLELRERVRVLEGEKVTRPRVGPFQRHSATSRAAALANYPRSGSQRHRILEFLEAQGDHGATRQELAQILGLSDDSVRPRVVELVEGGWVRGTDRTRPTPMGEQAEVLVAVDRDLRIEQIRQDMSPSPVAPVVSDESGPARPATVHAPALGGTSPDPSETTSPQLAVFDWEG